MRNIYYSLLLLMAASPAFAQNMGIGVTTPLQKVDIDGAIRIGGTVDNVAGSIRFNGTDFEGYDGLTWNSLTDAGVTTEVDPTITVSGANDVPVWNGSALVTSLISDDGSTVGIAGDASITGTLDMTNGKIENVAYPTVNGDAASKLYVDNQIGAIPGEVDPQVGAMANNRAPRWDGSALVSGSIYDNGSNVGINSPSPGLPFYVDGNSRIDGQLNMNSNKVINVTDPTANQDAATKKYVDDQITGLPAEADPVFLASPAGGITNALITNWNTAFGWGDHSTVGYLTSETDPQVGVNSNGQLSVWNGSALVASNVYDNGTSVAIGHTSPSANLDVDGNLILEAGTAVNEFSTDGALAGNSHNAVPTEQAVKTYVDGQVSGADDWTLSGNDLYPNNTAYDLGVGMTNPSEKLDVNGNARADRFISTVASGTAPFAVSSSTVVTNLNSDQLDGLSSGSFIRSDANDNVTAHTEWQDNQEVRFGNAADFRVFHDGANNVFRSDLHGAPTQFRGENAGGTLNNMIIMDPDNSVDLYYANTKRFETTATGVAVNGGAAITGAVTASSGTINTLGLNAGTTVTEFSTDVSLGGSSNNAIPTENAVKTYVDAQIATTGDNLGNHVATTNLNMNNREIDNVNYLDVRPGNGYGVRFWSSNDYSISMGNSTPYRFGPVQDYSIKMNMSNTAARGWTWGVNGVAPTAALSTGGNFQVAGTGHFGNAIIIDGLTVIDNGGGWHRSYGNTGWYNGTYGGGFYMTDATWIRTYNNKSFYHNAGTMRTDGTFQVGPTGDRFHVETTGHVGIGNTNPSYPLHVNRFHSGNWQARYTNGSANVYLNHSSGYGMHINTGFANNSGRYAMEVRNASRTHLYVRDDGLIGVGTTSPSYNLHVVGRIRTNAINETSDIRLKKNFESVENALEMVQQLSGKYYEWRTEEFPEMEFTEGRQLGVVAQEIAEVVPEVVHTDNEGYMSVEYAHLVPILIEAIKEQQKIIDGQNCAVAELENKVENYEALINQLDLDKLMRDYGQTNVAAK